MSGEEDRLGAVLPLIRKPCDVFELVAALHQYRDVAVQDVLCGKLHEAKSHDIEFFLPQLWYEGRNKGVKRFRSFEPLNLDMERRIDVWFV